MRLTCHVVRTYCRFVSLYDFLAFRTRLLCSFSHALSPSRGSRKRAPPWFQIRPLFRKRKAVEVTAVRALRKRLDLVARGRRGSARRGPKGFLASVFFLHEGAEDVRWRRARRAGHRGIASLLHPFVSLSFYLPSRCAHAFGRGPHEWRVAAVRGRAERLERTVWGRSSPWV